MCVRTHANERTGEKECREGDRSVVIISVIGMQALD